MAAPTNPVITNQPDLETLLDADHEIWSLTSHMLVKKGTNLEEALCTKISGPQDTPLDPNNPVAAVKIVDITKI